MNGLNEFLEKLSFWPQLTAEQKAFAESAAQVRDYNKGVFLHSGSDACLGFIYVISGGLRVYIMSEEGREITLFRLEPGDACALSASCVMSEITFDTYMTAEKDTRLLTVNSSAFAKLAEENIYVKCCMYELVTERFSSVMRAVQQLLFDRFDRRLARFLAAQYAETGKKEINMTHEEIARQVNSAREVVARMLKRFSEEGLVSLKRGTVIIENIDALREI